MSRTISIAFVYRFDEDKRTGEPRYGQLFKRFSEARLLILDEPSSGATDQVDERTN